MTYASKLSYKRVTNLYLKCVSFYGIKRWEIRRIKECGPRASCSLRSYPSKKILRCFRGFSSLRVSNLVKHFRCCTFLRLHSPCRSSFLPFWFPPVSLHTSVPCLTPSLLGGSSSLLLVRSSSGSVVDLIVLRRFEKVLKSYTPYVHPMDSNFPVPVLFSPRTHTRAYVYVYF